MSNKVHFLFPFEGPTTSIALRQPIFGDVNPNNYQIIVGHSRNGDLFSYKRTPTYQSMKLTFEKMREAPIQGFSGLEQIKTFLAAAAARKVRYIDHKQVNWSGVIISPTVEFTNQGRDSQGDQFGFSIEFEGQKI